jgi:putative flippase GtrA
MSTSAVADRGSLPRRLIARFEQLVRELGRFGVVGATAFVVDTLILNSVLDPDAEITSLHGPLGAKAFATLFSASVAFAGNRLWTWRHRPRSGLRREYALYFVFNVVGLLIAETCLLLSHYGLGALWPDLFHTRLADNVAAQGFGLVLGTLFRFWSYRQIVFREHPDEPAPVDTGSALATAVGDEDPPGAAAASSKPVIS